MAALIIPLAVFSLAPQGQSVSYNLDKHASIMEAVDLIGSSPLIQKTTAAMMTKSKVASQALIAGQPFTPPASRLVCDPCSVCECLPDNSLLELGKGFGKATGKLKPELLPDWEGCKDYDCYTSLICSDYATVPSNTSLPVPDCRPHADMCVPALSPADSKLKYVLNLDGPMSYCLKGATCNLECALKEPKPLGPDATFAWGQQIRCNKLFSGDCEKDGYEALKTATKQRQEMMKKSIDTWANLDDYLYNLHESHQKKPEGAEEAAFSPPPTAL